MSYLVLARKWRPQNFSDVVGQEPVVRTLRNALAQNRVAHAMIFSGVRGVGKTTLARVMAKALNCSEGVTAEPCNRCESCREITAGNAIDLHEIDGASNRGIQEIRELKENIRFFPTKDRYKIVIIDEVHMLTPEAFNALLKTLEEPPAHVFFMFATTELHKIPITILSRCQRYELKRVSFAELTIFLKKIAAREEVEIEDRALEMIVREAEGSVRDGLSLLDQIFSFSGKAVTLDDVTQVLGLVDRQVICSLAGALLAGDLGRSMELLDGSYAFGIDLKRFTNDLLSYFRAILITSISRKAEEILDFPDQERTVLQELAAAHSVETVHNCFRLLLKGIEEMQYSTMPRLVLETAFISATQAGQVVPVSRLLAGLEGLLRHHGDRDSLLPGPARIPADVEPEPHPLAVPPATGCQLSVGAVKPEEKKTGVTELEESTLPEIGAAPERLLVKAQPGGNAAGTEQEIPVVKTEVMPPQSERPSTVLEIKPRQKDVRKDWERFIDYVMERKQWMGHVLNLCSSARQEADALVLKFDRSSDCKMLQEPENLKYMTEYAQDYFQQELKVKVRIRGGAASSEAGAELEAPQEERRALANDPLVQMTIEVLGGQVVGIRTGPRFR